MGLTDVHAPRLHLYLRMAKHTLRQEPRWPALVALLGVGGLRLALPNALSIGPRWLLLGVMAVISVPLVWARVGGSHRLNQVMGTALNALVTADMLWSLGLLVRALVGHQESPQAMLRSAAALWIANILIFASWYWRLDAGGPNARDLRKRHADGAFLFPPMTMDDQTREETGLRNWSPNFVDYLFLAFNTSTAFSPTDAPVLDRWAKLLMMVQSIISLTTVSLLAARAVNIL